MARAAAAARERTVAREGTGATRAVAARVAYRVVTKTVNVSPR